MAPVHFRPPRAWPLRKLLLAGNEQLTITTRNVFSFQNLGILFIGKKEVPEILFKRKLADFQNRFYGEMLTEKGKEKMHEQSEKEAKDMNLNSVKICFEAFMLRNDTLYPICNPVYSRPIANQSKPLDHYSRMLWSKLIDFIRITWFGRA